MVYREPEDPILEFRVVDERSVAKLVPGWDTSVPLVTRANQSPQLRYCALAEGGVPINGLGNQARVNVQGDAVYAFGRPVSAVGTLKRITARTMCSGRIGQSVGARTVLSVAEADTQLEVAWSGGESGQ